MLFKVCAACVVYRVMSYVFEVVMLCVRVLLLRDIVCVFG